MKPEKTELNSGNIYLLVQDNSDIQKNPVIAGGLTNQILILRVAHGIQLVKLIHLQHRLTVLIVR